MTEIISTHDIAEAETNGEPEDVRTDMVATHQPAGKGIEFHVSMRDYTMEDMEALIVSAAAQMIVGRHNDRDLARKIEAKCIELIDLKASKALESVTSEIVDQPLTPQFVGGKDAVTMREFIGLYGREYLTQTVDSDGKPAAKDHWGSSRGKPRIEQIVSRLMDHKFKLEIEKATNAAIREIQAAVTAQHKELIAAESARIRDALAKAVS